MDIETLNNYRHYKDAIQTIHEELDMMYNPVSAVSFRYHYESSKDMTGSTIRTLRKIERQEERLQHLLDLYVDLAEEVETWLEDLDDPIAETIVRKRFILDKSWQEIANDIYGYGSNQSTPRMYLSRLLEKENSTTGSNE